MKLPVYFAIGSMAAIAVLGYAQNCREDILPDFRNLGCGIGLFHFKLQKRE